MKGIIFSEFLDLVEDKFGLEMVDRIISESELDSNGAYTAVGTYEFSEMIQLLASLSKNTKIDTEKLLQIYGEHFFNVISASYPDLLATFEEPIHMLSSIENHIHIEVRKIYPDAELPTFFVEEKSNNHLIMVYKSSRAMHSFGLGLMNRTFQHFNSEGKILVEKINDDGTEVKFIINKLND